MKLFDGEKVFSFPKPLSLLRFFCEQCLEEEDIALDFFAGSGSTGHAVISLNASDRGRRRFILIQREEPLNERVPHAHFKDVFEVTHARLRAVIKKQRAELEETEESRQSLGYRLLQVVSSPS